MRHFFLVLGHVALLLTALTLVPQASAPKPQTLIVGEWRGAPASARFGQNVDLVLRLTSAADAPHVRVEVIPSGGVTVVAGDSRWAGAMSKGQVLDLPFTVQVIANGDWTFGASITNKRPDTDQVSGAVLRIRARDGVATFTAASPDPADASSPLP